MEDFIIKRAGPNDAPALTEILRAAYAPHYATIPDMPDAITGLDQELSDHEGWMITGPSGPVAVMVLKHQGQSLRLANIAVDPKCGGQGLGRRLMDHATERARQLGMKDMVLTTHARMDGNIRMYEKLGWSVTQRKGPGIGMTKPLR